MSKSFRQFATLLVLAFALAACDSPKSTIESLRNHIADYKANPTPERERTIETEFAKLDQQIEKLEDAGKSAEAATFRSSQENLLADFRAARMVHALQDAQSAVQDIGDAFKDAGRSIGEAVRQVTADPTPTE